MRAAACLLLVLLCAVPASARQERELFVLRPAAAPQRASRVEQVREDAVVDRAPVAVRIDALFDDAAGVAQHIVVNTGEHRWRATLERLDVDAQRFRSWVGRLDGIADSHAVITERDGVVSGLINAVGVSYQVRTDESGEHVLERLDVTKFPKELDPLSVAGVPATGVSDYSDGHADSTVDVLMLYTPAARRTLGGAAHIQALASQVLSDTNTAFMRSGVRAQVRLVAAVEFGFTESASMTEDLLWLSSSPQSRLLRDAAGADVVQLLVTSPDYSACGVAFLLNSLQSADFAAFSVADTSCRAQYTSAHEIAHNLGSQHAPEDGPSPALFPFSYGLKDPVRKFRTVMAYACPGAECPRIPNFSSPRVFWNGAPTGSLLQDNARSITEAAPYVANLRSARDGTARGLAAPTDLAATVSGNIVTVRWNGTDAAESFVVQVGTSRGQYDVFNASVGAARSASGPLAVGVYFWRVIAVNAAGQSAPSAEGSFVVGPCAVAAPPEAFSSSVSGRTVNLIWRRAGDSGAEYVVEVGTASGLHDVLSLSVGAQSSLTVTAAPPGTYYVRVRAQNACGMSAPSNEQIIVVR